MRTSLQASPKRPTTCATCYAWGVLPGRRCGACTSFGQNHMASDCVGCRRVVPVKKDYCRLCWHQAALDAKGQASALAPFLLRVRDHQLFLADLQRPRTPGVRFGRQGRPKPHPTTAPPPANPVTGQVQLRLVDAVRDFTRFDRRRHANLTNPWLTHAQHRARVWGESRGWTSRVMSDVDRALVILLSGHAEGDTIRHSELLPVLRRYRLSAERTAEILAHLDLLDDDRTPTFETWLDRKLTGLSSGIRHDVEHWARTLREGGPRTRQRSPDTVVGYLTAVAPILQNWSRLHDHLREIARDDILVVAGSLHGTTRAYSLSVLRSLFRHCKKTGTIFRDPTARIRIGRHRYGAIVPLPPAAIEQTVRVASTPASRLALALAAVHAARPKAIRQLRLDDVDLGNRRLTITGRLRPLDELTHRMLLEWLEHRRTRWPNTANPHLIINQHTAMEIGQVSGVWANQTFRNLTATLERLRVDRQLDEALTRGPDPLHLSAVFGLDDKTAIRYADAARQILETATEQPPPASDGGR